jgi:hypothetical protein
MYWSIHRYPSLSGRPRAERQAIVQAALRQNRRSSRRRGFGFGWRLLVVFAGITAAAIAATFKLSPRADLLSWRTWIAPAIGALFIYGYLLVEINGAVHTAVKQYLDSKGRR